jgi:dihydropteroate synthase
MFTIVEELKVPYILMHMKGSPENMKDLATYDNLVIEVYQYFQSKIIELKNRGVNDIIIDPGFGFAKNIDQNFVLLKNLNIFKNLNVPILAGLSRKSMIYKSLGITAEESLNGTTALNMISLMNGASILRVHDVKEAVQTIQLYKRYNGITN